jgi:hypothetical protein
MKRCFQIEEKIVCVVFFVFELNKTKLKEKKRKRKIFVGYCKILITMPIISLLCCCVFLILGKKKERHRFLDRKRET